MFLPDLQCQSLEEIETEFRGWKLNTHVPFSTIADTIAAINVDLYPYVCTCLHILLLMPVSTVTAEHSFSFMRRLKHIFGLIGEVRLCFSNYGHALLMYEHARSLKMGD